MRGENCRQGARTRVLRCCQRRRGLGMQGTVPAGTPAVLRNILEHGRLAVDVSGRPPLSAGQASDTLKGLSNASKHSRVQFQRDVSISSPKTQEETDFLSAPSVRWMCRNLTRVPSPGSRRPWVSPATAHSFSTALSWAP